VGVLALADLGVAVIGTLVAALAVRTRARDLLGPLLALPLLVPVVIGGARASSPLLAAGHGGGAPARWLLTLGLYDLVFGLIAYALIGTRRNRAPFPNTCRAAAVSPGNTGWINSSKAITAPEAKKGNNISAQALVGS